MTLAGRQRHCLFHQSPSLARFRPIAVHSRNCASCCDVILTREHDVENQAQERFPLSPRDPAFENAVEDGNSGEDDGHVNNNGPGCPLQGDTCKGGR